MKVELGRKYRTRDGREAVVLAVDESIDTYQVLGKVRECDPDRWMATTWAIDGKYIPIVDSNECDLVEFVEPVKFKVRRWVNLYANGTISPLYASRDHAERSASFTCIEIREIILEWEVPQ